MDLFEDGERRVDVEVAEVAVHPRRVERLGHAQRQQRLHLRAEEEPPLMLGPEQRLDAEPVAGDDQFALLRVPQRQGEHAPETVDEGLAVLGVGVEDHLAVAAGAEAVAQLGELLLQLAVVVDLTVED